MCDTRSLNEMLRIVGHSADSIIYLSRDKENLAFFDVDAVMHRLRKQRRGMPEAYTIQHENILCNGALLPEMVSYAGNHVLHLFPTKQAMLEARKHALALQNLFADCDQCGIVRHWVPCMVTWKGRDRPVAIAFNALRDYQKESMLIPDGTLQDTDIIQKLADLYGDLGMLAEAGFVQFASMQRCFLPLAGYNLPICLVPWRLGRIEPTNDIGLANVPAYLYNLYPTGIVQDHDIAACMQYGVCKIFNNQVLYSKPPKNDLVDRLSIENHLLDCYFCFWEATQQKRFGDSCIINVIHDCLQPWDILVMTMRMLHIPAEDFYNRFGHDKEVIIQQNLWQIMRMKPEMQHHCKYYLQYKDPMPTNKKFEAILCKSLLDIDTKPARMQLMANGDLTPYERNILHKQ